MLTWKLKVQLYTHGPQEHQIQCHDNCIWSVDPMMAYDGISKYVWIPSRDESMSTELYDTTGILQNSVDIDSSLLGN